jgi:Trk K+ transport system NAD-binding subunit
MKFLTPQLIATLQQREMRRNLAALLKVLGVLAATVGVYSVIFHMLMLYEGQQHSWMTGVYWTLTVMSTLGFGDITFHSDMGRIFSIIVLMTGIVLLLIVLPFAFIRNFYAPWLEAQLKLRAPRAVAADMAGHVILCRHDSLAHSLIARLSVQGTPYVVLESDPAKAVQLHGDGISVVVGEPDAVETWKAVRAEAALLIVANLEDAANTNVVLTVREHTLETPITAIAEHLDSVDILELSGAGSVVALKHRLGEQLASRVCAGNASAHRIGGFENLVIAEFPVRGTQLVGRTLLDTNLREVTGLSIVGVWKRGRLEPARAETVLTEDSVPVVVGTDDQISLLDAAFVIYQAIEASVIVIGGGKVGRAVIRALGSRGLTAQVIESSAALCADLEGLVSKVIIGDASNLRVMQQAGIEHAPSVVLTTHDDAVNIFLAIYCRRLNPHCHIVSRVTHERNIEAIYRAGANFVLSQSTLGAKLVLSALTERELAIIGEDVDVFVADVPRSLQGRELCNSDIGAKTGLIVIGIRKDGGAVTVPSASSLLEADAQLVLIGTKAQRQGFAKLFEADPRVQLR